MRRHSTPASTSARKRSIRKTRRRWVLPRSRSAVPSSWPGSGISRCASPRHRTADRNLPDQLAAPPAPTEWERGSTLNYARLSALFALVNTAGEDDSTRLRPAHGAFSRGAGHGKAPRTGSRPSSRSLRPGRPIRPFLAASYWLRCATG
jgi:hypothetical protein